MRLEIANTFRKAFGYVLPFKMIITGLVAAVGGSGYVGFLSEYATYFYSWHLGFRVPAEGSPYLKIAISSITFLILISSALIYLILTYIIKLTIFYKDNIDEIEARINISKVFRLLSPPFFFMKYLQSRFGLKLFLPFSIIIGILFFVALSKDQNMQLTFTNRVLLSISIALLYLVPALPLINKKYLTPASLIFVTLFLITSPLILFNQNIYSSILKEIGYGGSMKIKILRDNKTEDYYLLLRTTDSIFVKQNNSYPIEIPLSQVKMLSYVK